MSLRTFRTLIFLALSAALLTWAAYGPKPDWTQTDEQNQWTRPADAVGAITYQLQTDRWTRFPVPPGTQTVRCIFNANLPGSVESQDLRFRVAWRWLDGRGRELGGENYSLRTVNQDCHPGCGNQSTLFYDQSGLSPMEGRRLTLHVGELPGQAAQLALRLESADAPLTTIAARVYVPDTNTDVSASEIWQSLSRRERRQLLAENALGRLDEAERENLLRNRYRPVGPVGMEGRDYRSRRLYTHPDPPARICRKTPDRQTVPPEGLRIRTWPVSSETAISWRFDGRGETHLRLDLRTPADTTVTYKTFDQNRNILQEERLLLQATGISGDLLEDGDRVGERQSFYLTLPPQTDSLVLTSEGPVYCSAWVRPPELPRHGIQAENPEEDSWLHAWFSLLPHTAGEARTLILAERPETDEALDSIVEPKEYAPIVDLKPGGDWLGRYVMMERRAADLPKDAPLTTVFTRVPVNREKELTIQGNPGETVYPILAFQRKSRNPVKLSVTLDGKLIWEDTLSARGGELSLGQVSAGKHTLHIRTEDKRAAIWVNHVRPRRNFLRRKPAVLLDQPLTYRITKPHHDRFTVTTRILRTPGGKKPVVLKATLDNPNPPGGATRAYTFPKRQITLEPVEVGRTRMPSGKSQALAESRPWFIHLDADLPPGDYTLRFERVSGRTPYLLVSHLGPEKPAVKKSVSYRAGESNLSISGR
ncbi:MAG: hypothetical protein QNK37_27730 [Acidobacteriota bacterium]|nr:hypothetical protein [Acidobacteriota bacterium]